MVQLILSGLLQPELWSLAMWVLCLDQCFAFLMVVIASLASVMPDPQSNPWHALCFACY